MENALGSFLMENEMMEFGSDSEILEFAVAREIEAYKFYMALAERMERPKMQKVFEELANEEFGHKERLELEIMKTGRVAAIEDISKIDTQEYYIEGQYQFDMDYKSMLTMAIEKEKMAFRLYTDLAANVGDEQSRELLLTLAEEEVKHKLRFEYEYDALLKEE